MEAPDDELGTVPHHDVVPRLSGTPGALRVQAPALGEHNDEEYGRIGYGAERIRQLRDSGAI